jgi:dihydroorotase
MRISSLLLAIALLLSCEVISLRAQQVDLLLKNGHLIDVRNKINQRMDVAITDGKISAIGPAIPDAGAKKVIDLEGLFISAGFIDIHTHVFVGSKAGFADGINSISPDDFACRSGVTTVVDAGTSGWKTFPLFKKQVIDQSKTRILAFLNIVGGGMGDKEQSENLLDMNPHSTYLVASNFPGTVVGIKIGHYEGSEWIPFDRALEAAEKANVPLFVECHLPQYSLEDQLKRMRPGDIITHSFEKVSERMSVIDEKGMVRPFVKAAHKKGILFDVGHGGAGFWFSEAIPALNQGLTPNSFGTDLHRFSINAGMKDMSNVMSKYLAMGMDLEDVIYRATWAPASAIKREDLGHVSKGAVADLAVWGIRKGNFGFVDAGGNKIEGTEKFEVELTLREGKIVWDLNGLSARKFATEMN